MDDRRPASDRPARRPSAPASRPRPIRVDLDDPTTFHSPVRRSRREDWARTTDPDAARRERDPRRR
jgi:hypothetical protein